MRQPGLAHLATFVAGYCATAYFAWAVSVSDYSVEVSAIVQHSPPQISLRWPGDSNATGYGVYRKLRDDTSWSAVATLAANATNFVDTNVIVGRAFEYQILKTTPTYPGEGDIYAGIQVPLVEYRGKVILLIDNTFTSSLSNELVRLQQDLVGDGWTVLRHDVPRMSVDPANTSPSFWAARSNELANVKALITGDYHADPTNVNTVFILGHIPVPYSGDSAFDEHVDHVGAWPADTFYASLTGAWPDFSRWDLGGSDPRNWNAPGDGKFDPSILPSDLTLRLGRVDLANLPAFSQSETNLLRQYLNKDHNYRVKLFAAQRRGLVDDNLGFLNGEAPAVNGWRNFAPFFGATNIFATSDWFGSLTTNSYLWGYGCGGGTYTSCSGVGSTSDFANKDPQVVFTMFFGSYFGDWDSQNNFLRAALCTSNYTLTSAWVGRPYWFFHHMALGETIGFSTLLSQNNQSLYSSGIYQHRIHISLMGDPTLRMHTVAPPSALIVTANSSGEVDLSWNASTDNVQGYHVYRASAGAGPFTRLTTNLVTGLNYTDPAASSNGFYMVRAVKLEVGGSGTYYNPSQGVFQRLDVSAGPENTITLLSRTTGSSSQTYGSPLTFTVSVTGNATTPGGSVIFKDGSTSLATVPLVAGTSPNATASYTSYTDLNVGGSPHAIAAYYQGDGTHNPSDSSSSVIAQIIIVKPLNYTGISAANKVYDATQTASLTGSATTLPAEAPGSGATSDGAPYTGDTVSFTTGTLTGIFANQNAASGKPVTVTGGVTLTAGGQSGNYAVGLPNAAITAAITALPVTLIGIQNYDGTATVAASLLTVGNNLDSGNLTLSGSATLPSANGGLQTLSSFAGLTLGGTAATNYTFTGASGAVRINPAPGAFAIVTTTNKAVTFATSNLINAASDAGVTLSVTAVASSSVAGGVVVLNGDQTITYAPATDYAGADSFSYTLSDDAGGGSPGTVTVQVNTTNVSSIITNYIVNGDGSFSITASGLPGHAYDVQAADTVSGPWSKLGTTTALSSGVVGYTDTDAPNHVSRVYRLAQP